MEFTKRLRDGVRRGDITCSVRICMRPHVKRGNRYRMGEGQIEIDSIEQIELADVTPKLARESGFDGVVDLLKIAKHGPGTNVYLVRFHYLPPGVQPSSGASRPRAAATRQRRAKSDSRRQRERLARILARLPEAKAVTHDTHLSLEVRKKRFGYFLDDHHGDGRIALQCKASADLRDMLEEQAPAQFHVPKYLGHKGWVGLWLDVGPVDWSAVQLALREAYLLVAPKALTQVKAQARDGQRSTRSGW